MDAFSLHKNVVDSYRNYLRSFIKIKDVRIREFVEKKFTEPGFIPEPIIQFNPSYLRSETLADLQSQGKIHPELINIFGDFRLYKHQIEGVKKGVSGQGFVVTSGTGSGKSLIFLATIFNHILNISQKEPGVKAILVYPMNALINSQLEEIQKYELNFLLQFVAEKDRYLFDPGHEDNAQLALTDLVIKIRNHTGKECPFTYDRYTGQEGTEERERIKSEQPDIILTNYMMLELVMTRANESWLRNSIHENLTYLVFDELHTYRGRQGADVSLLIRRIKQLAKKPLICIGTSATMTSIGKHEARKQAVADVATSIFGEQYSTEQIIGEYLENSTASGETPGKFELQEAIHARINTHAPAEEFVRNPLAVWLENRIALQTGEGHLERGYPLTLQDIVSRLMEDADESKDSCEQAIRLILEWGENLNIKAKQDKTLKSYLPFKIHQFISQTSTVYVTLESKDTRTISIETGRYVKKDGDDRFIFPVLFSRHSGHEFVCVRKNFENNRLEPRDPADLPVQITKDDLKGNREEGRKKRVLREDDFPDGYIIIPEEGEEDLWSEDHIQELPQSWWKDKKGQVVVDNYYAHRLPQKIYFDETGNFSTEPEYDMWGWFMPVKLLFDPTAGLIYDLKTNENTKLMRLGNEGRSTATTILSFAVMSELHYQGEDKSIQKLLSFTDNRQDASLQAGHFNDFINTGRLRSALYHALKAADGNQLKVYQLAEALVPQLNLKESDYVKGEANNDWPDPENLRALKKYLLIRLLYDLRRGWRYNLPNLEQTALLDIGYERLDDFCKQDGFFSDLLLFKDLDAAAREKILVQLLNFFRTSYALDHRILTNERNETEEFTKNKLDSDKQWSLDKNERIEVPVHMVSRNPGETQRFVFTASLGPQSYVGKYFKRLFREHDLEPLKGEEFSTFIEQVCEALKKANLLSAEEVRGRKDVVKGYRLRVDNILWKLGDGNTVLPDEIRIAAYKKQDHRPNAFFKRFYQTNFLEFHKQFTGREHTGQLSNADRIDREKKFREGELSALFCSPTMELGIDIANLNIVHMRNVPPSPANYVQRSGRAGRSGQTAVVFNYCSNFSPHDRYYFKAPSKMVSGAVVPPRIDLTNEELILSHFNAYILMNLGLNIHLSVEEVLDLSDKKNLPVKSIIKNQIKNAQQFYQQNWIQGFSDLLHKSIEGIENAPWYTPEWLETTAAHFPDRFDEAFERWRLLYRTALHTIQSARAVMDDHTVKQNSPKMKEAKRQHNIGLTQKALLLNQNRSTHGNESEFYVFRYLASEGFLPGYNFTRLPVRAFAGYRYKEEGDYISRARFVALREFGPNNLIYHNGNKYRITKMQLTDASLKMQKLKISKETGYAFLGEETEKFNNDPITNAALKDQSRTDIWSNLVELTETEAVPQERISCEEEERMSTGFDIEQFFSYPKGIEHTHQSVIKEGNQPLLRLIFGQATRLIQVNQKWRRSKDSEGFLVDDRSGKWLRKKDTEDPETDEHAKTVKVFARDHADTLYIQPVKALELNNDQVISLAYALKRGVENLFEVEESEVGVWVMGKPEEPNIMLFESSEGSLGILSQLVESPQKLRELFVKAYTILHFDPETFTDKKPDLPKATYDDLLSYFNQRYHDQLDRHALKEPLERLIKCEPSPMAGGNDRDAHYNHLLENYDKNSGTELKFIRYLYENNYTLPDKAQVNIKECYVNADFVYQTKNGPVLIFCDGNVHDQVTVAREDSGKRHCLRDHGYDVVVWHYSEPMEKLVERRKDVFRKI